MHADPQSFRFARSSLSLAILLALSQPALAEVVPVGTLGGTLYVESQLSDD